MGATKAFDGDRNEAAKELLDAAAKEGKKVEAQKGSDFLKGEKRFEERVRSAASTGVVDTRVGVTRQ